MKRAISNIISSIVSSSEGATLVLAGAPVVVRRTPGARRLGLTTALVAPTVLVHPSCSSWYNGGNVPGKKQMYMGYTGGIPEYRKRCDEVAAAGYSGFKLG